MFSHEMMAGRLASTTFMVCHSTSFPCTCHPASPQDLPSSTQQMSRPFSTFTVPNPLSRNVGSPFPIWPLTHHGHICLPRDTTLAKLWCLCGAGTVHLGSQLQFLARSAKHEKAGSVQGAQGGRIEASATITMISTYNHPDSSFSGSNRMVFWRDFSAQGELQITHHQ